MRVETGLQRRSLAFYFPPTHTHVPTRPPRLHPLAADAPGSSTELAAEAEAAAGDVAAAIGSPLAVAAHQPAAAGSSSKSGGHEDEPAPTTTTTTTSREAEPSSDAAPQQQHHQQQQHGAQPSAAPPLPRVPWALNTTITVMVLWLLGFWLAAYAVVPTALAALGADITAGTGRMQALKHLALDMCQLALTLGLLRRALREYRPRSLGLFALRWRPASAWAGPAAAGAAAFPLVDWLHKRMVSLMAGAEAAGGVDQLLAGGDPVAAAMWFAVLALCAPVWEEVMFRGFLLPSLARYMPPWAAVGATSLVFALVHFTREGFAPLLLLGAVFGAVYVRTRNLLPAVLLHSLWNVVLLVQIGWAAGALA